MTEHAAGNPNRLIHEKSPYLIQHAHNPVDWYPWGEEAFEVARRQDKPIFLSIGYSTCHWCHVMERESFEDTEVARLMNESFINIKVDREERPDIDGIYMTVCQMMTGAGGWPLTVLLTPDRKPFFAGTYFPKESRYGRAGMLDLIPRLVEVWKHKRGDIEQSALEITSALQGNYDRRSGEALQPSILDQAFQQLARSFDESHGGFGSSPKFPSPHQLLFLLRYWSQTGNERALFMVEKTLQAMRQGGIYDHIGFGFHRYSTDSQWLVPHFEKMLYDQAMLAMAYTEAWQASRNETYARTVREVLDYVLRDMRSPEGGFYSAEDADSEGEEGRFYLWTPGEIESMLSEQEARVFLYAFNIQSNGNFREEAIRHQTGRNIPHTSKTSEQLSLLLEMPLERLEVLLESARKKLFEQREKRIHPYKDDKILTDWNGLMIAALAKAGQAMGQNQYVEAASKAADFILNQLRNSEGLLLHRFRNGDASITAHLDDYAFFVWGLLDLYEASFDEKYLEAAVCLNEEMLNRFWDEKNGGLFFSAFDSRDILVRRKEIYDGATPSGNSVAALNLIRLGRMSGNADLERKADSILRVFSESLNQTPMGYTHCLQSLFFSGASSEIVIAGRPESEDTQILLKALHSFYFPCKVVLLRPEGQPDSFLFELAPFIQSLISIQGQATAYICCNHACQSPTTDAERMLEVLQELKSNQQQKARFDGA